MKTYIALDLETTGFDAELDQVIEIAAIKFENNKVIDTFDTLINPQTDIPSMVSHITGIKHEDVADAPTFEQIQAKLKEFLGSYPIVGHNIAFDISFLNKKGLNLANPLFDTLELSSILLPGLASYSLDTLSRILKIRHEKKHRAYSDADASFQLFTILQGKINEIDNETYQEILKIIARSEWPLKEIFEFRTHSAHTANKKRKESKGQETEDNSPIPPEEEILKFFDDEGTLAQNMKDFESRKVQSEMSNLILDSFKNSKNYVIEAGTGIGKTLSYLLPSIYWSKVIKEKVVVSTYTHNLQEQILKKDLPILQNACENLSSPIKFKSAVLKGRRNYISLKRLEAFLDKQYFLDHEVSLLIKIMLWLKKTDSGDLEEISIQGKEYSLLDEICCAEHVCPHDNAEFASGCYLMHARRKAEEANIVIVNHALLLQDAISENPLIPDYGYLVVDEAHHLEKVATDTLTISISFTNFLKPFEKIRSFFPTAGKKAATDNGKELVTLLDKIISAIEIFFGLTGIFMEKGLGSHKYQYSLMLTEKHFDTPDWQKIQDMAKSIRELGNDMLKKLDSIGPIGEGHSIKNYKYECEKRLSDLENAVILERPDFISWILKNIDGNITLKNAPANIGPTMDQLLYSKKNSIILTSGTMRTDHTFSFIRKQLALDERFNERYFPSHFAYPDQVKVLIPTDLPEPNSDGYFLGCANLIEDIIRKNGGRTLVLFTSKSSLMSTYKKLAPKMKEEGFQILGQNITGGRGKIVEHFKDEPGSCAIFGTASFWEGIDIKGNDLNCIVLYKLPFDPPEDPIIFTRSQMYKDSFSEYQLPRAILKFKQGFGRLIRSSTDTGSIIVLDPRIANKNYGRQFIESLPEGIKIHYTNKNELTTLL